MHTGRIDMAVARISARAAALPRHSLAGRSRAAALTGLLVVASALCAQSASAAVTLPDGRAWEMVSPAEKAGASVNPLGFGFGAPLGGLIVAAGDGGSVTYVANGPVTSEPEGNRAIEGNQVLSRRGAGGWSSKDIVTPHEKGEGLLSGTAQEYQLFSPDLSLALVAPFGWENPLQEPPLVPGRTSEERGLYLRHDATCGDPSTCFEPVVTSENNTVGTPFGGQLEFRGASADLSHVVFKAPVALAPKAPAQGGLYERNAGVPALEQLQFVSLLPAKATGKPKAAFDAQLGNDVQGVSAAARNAVSSGGTRVFWSGLKTEASEVRNLYMRDTSSGRTIRIDAEEGVKPKVGKAEVHFQIASTDGSRVFFTDTGGLTADSLLKGAEGGPADLYVCEVEAAGEAESCPSGKLTDLTGPEHGFTGPGDVVGAVLGASDDGSTIYFVADGAQAGGTTGTCPNPNSELEAAPEDSCTLYMAHNAGAGWEDPKPILSLSARDAPDWAAAGERLSNLTSRVSSEGRYVAFMSERPLTGYDNRDASPAAHEALDEEVFLLDSSKPGLTGLVCASCNPNPAQRPTGVFDTENAGEGAGLIVDPFAVVWNERWLAGSIPPWTALSTVDAPYQSRYLLDEGRLYFNSADALVAADVNKRSEQIPGESEPAQVGVEDVYQYEPEGLGSCASGVGGCVSLLSSGTSEHESAFLDASSSGNDVFFLTSQSLVSTDIDSVNDVYDARVCSAGSPCITPPPPAATPCDEVNVPCRAPGGGGVPGFGSAGSETPLGAPAVAKQQTLPSKTVVKPTPKPLTRAQKLKRALAACRKAHKHARAKRASCERQAHHRYGAKKAAKHKGAKK